MLSLTYGKRTAHQSGVADKVFIGTLYIAGYSADGKAKCKSAWYWSILLFFHKQADFQIALPDNPNQTLSQDENVRVLQFCITQDWEELRAHPSCLNNCAATIIYEGIRHKKQVYVHRMYKNVQRKSIYLPEYLLRIRNIYSFAAKNQ